jgi:hypothetical protein
MIEGGHAPNALPQSATAVVNVRMMPGSDVEDVLARLIAVVDNPDIEVLFAGGGRPSDPSPLTEEILGYEAQDIGSARLLQAHEEDIAQLEVTRITEEVRNGDRLLPNEAREIAASFQPHAADEDIGGLMIAVDGGVSQIGTLDIVAINRGHRDGVDGGQIMAIYQTGEIVRDDIARQNVQIPDSRAGLLMIFRAFEKMSYGIVLKSNRPLAIMDRVGNP